MKFSRWVLLDFIVAFIIVTLLVIALAHSGDITDCSSGCLDDTDDSVPALVYSGEEEQPQECMFNFVLKNNTDTKVIYGVYWLSAPFNSLYLPQMMAGELKPGKEIRSSYKYVCGNWAVTFDGDCIDYGHGKPHQTTDDWVEEVPQPKCIEEI
jgi:hypothetical protein